MSRCSTPKVSYQRLDTDSGYLSDLVDAARKSDEVAGKLLLSSSDDRSRELVMNTFDDTEWDTRAKGIKLATLKRECSKLAKQVKKPTRFPIIPLEFTLARLRKKAHVRRRRSTTDCNEDAKACRPDDQALVDRRGRTRAATRKATAAKSKTAQLSAAPDDVQQENSMKRKNSQE